MRYWSMWIGSPAITFNPKTGAFATYGNMPFLNMPHEDMYLVVRIGKAGRRLCSLHSWKVCHVAVWEQN